MYNSLPTLHGVILAHDHERVGFQTRHWCARKSTYILLIFITAHDGEVTRSRPLKADVVGCLRELFSAEALLDAIRPALESDREGSWRSSGSHESPPRSRQEVTDRRPRMAASPQPVGLNCGR
jgi:hypothetical protein